MGKYRVVIQESTDYTYELEADNEELAVDLAMDTYMFGNEKLHGCVRTNVNETMPECVDTEELLE